jgi:hypothetical protein
MRFDWLRPALITCLGLALLTQFGCAFGEFRPDDPFNRQYELERSQKRYSDLVRWSKFDEAAQFVAADDRAAFEARMPDFKEIRFTDHETAPWQLDEEKRETVIEVTYTGYSMRTPLEIEVHETQHWTREGNNSSWKVVSEFKDLDRLASQ